MLRNPSDVIQRQSLLNKLLMKLFKRVAERHRISRRCLGGSSSGGREVIFVVVARADYRVKRQGFQKIGFIHVGKLWGRADAPERQRANGGETWGSEREAWII
ncbi:unnamed protein product [Closterium sp. NIES-54]